MSSSSNCILCATDECSHLAVGKCDHPICAKCAMRLRVKNKDKSCALCKQEMACMLVAAAPLRLFSEYGVSNVDDVQGGMELDGPSSIIFVDCRAHHRELESLRSFICPIKSCSQRHPTEVQLTKHLKASHNLQICPLCFEHQSLFVSEHTLRTDEQLEVHMEMAEHPLCLFCDRRFFCGHSLYRHMTSAHETCPLCPPEQQNRFYENAAARDEHLRNDHFLCPICCQGRGQAQRSAEAFATSADLDAHLLAEHAAARSRPRGNGGGGGGGGGGRGRYVDLDLQAANPTRHSHLVGSRLDGNGSSSSSSSSGGGGGGDDWPAVAPVALRFSNVWSSQQQHQQQQQQQQLRQATGAAAAVAAAAASSLEPKPKRLYLAAAAGDLGKLAAEDWFGEEQFNWGNPASGHKTALTVACAAGKTAVVAFLIRAGLGSGLDVNKREGSSRTPLHCACAEGHVDIVQLLLACPRIELNAADSMKMTPLHLACQGGRRACVEALLETPGLDISLVDRSGKSALAVAKGEDIRLLMLMAGAVDLPVPTLPSAHPAHALAAETRAEASARIEPPPPPTPPPAPRAVERTNPPPRGVGHQAYNAACKSELGKLQKLLSRYSDTSIANWHNADFGGWTPLIGAAAHGRADCIEMLSGVPGLDVNAVNLDGETALVWAVRVGDAQCVRLLCNLPGVDVGLAAKNGRTPLDLAKSDEVRNILREAMGI